MEPFASIEAVKDKAFSAAVPVMGSTAVFRHLCN
jgi:hypothetical protein